MLGGIGVTDTAAWSGWTVLFFFILVIGFAGLTAMFLALRVPMLRSVLRPWIGSAAVVAMLIGILGMAASLLLPAWFPDLVSAPAPVSASAAGG